MYFFPFSPDLEWAPPATESAAMSDQEGVHERSHTSVPIIAVVGDEEGQIKKVPPSKRLTRWSKRIRPLIRSRLPCITWAKGYTLSSLLCDAIAGVTVGLMIIPQGIAFAELAGLPVQYGLYSAMSGGFVYCILGSVPEMSVGPTAIMSLLTRTQIQAHTNRPAFAVLLTFLNGLIILLFGVLHLGFLIDFISAPVISAFVSAAAITIASSQLSSLLGIKFQKRPRGLPETYLRLFQNIKEIQLGDAVMGIICIIVLTLLRTLKDINKPVPPQPVSPAAHVISNVDLVGETEVAETPVVRRPSQQSVRQRRRLRLGKGVRRLLWLISVSRNAVVVIAVALVAYVFLKTSGESPFSLTDKVAGGLPAVGIPDFTPVDGNVTYSFFEVVADFGSGLVVVPFISIIEAVAIGKAFSKGKVLDATQEMIAIGCCNLMGSLIQSMPLTSSFSRTAVNAASGIRTPFAGVFTGVVVILALGVLSPSFQYIPKTSLAAVMIGAVVFMIEFKEPLHLWHTRRIDLIPWGVTFFGSLLFSLEYGIGFGVAASLFFLLFHSSRPGYDVLDKGAGSIKYLSFTPHHSLYFPSAEHMRSCLNKEAWNRSRKESADEIVSDPIPVVFDFTHIKGLDSTSIKVLESIPKDFKARSQPLFLSNVRPSVFVLLCKIWPSLPSNCVELDTPMVLSDELTLLEAVAKWKKLKALKCGETSGSDQICSKTVTGHCLESPSASSPTELKPRKKLRRHQFLMSFVSNVSLPSQSPSRPSTQWGRGRENFLLMAKTSSSHHIVSLLKAIHINETALITATEQGLKVTVEEARCVQATAFLAEELFAEYEIVNKSLSFCVNLRVLLDCLTIFGESTLPGSPSPSLKLCYAGTGHPLVLLLEEPEAVTDCTIQTLEAFVPVDFSFSSDEGLGKVYFQTEALRGIFSELDSGYECAKLSFTLSPDRVVFVTKGTLANCEWEIPATSDLIESFDVEQALAGTFSIPLLKLANKIVQQATKIRIKMDPRGFVDLQAMIALDSGIASYIEFFISPNSELLDDDE